ncbi:SMI1/KNR4 family protein [Streptomyces capparidis]
MTDTTPFDWRPFLHRWSAEWADSLPAGEARDADDEAARQARWLGLPPASEERIAAMEERLGRRMPPSYREFLKVSDGWRHAGGFVWLLAGTEAARWHENESGLADILGEYLDDDATPEERDEVEIWHRGLQLDVESDATHVLMDPEDVDEHGEWAVYTWASWRAAPPERHPNFLEFMREMHREFHSLRADPGEDEPEFTNDTTRELDALVEQARRDALRGEWEQSLRALDEAARYGRPRATGLGDQLRHLLGQTHTAYFEGLATDPRYAPELLPPLTAEHAAHSHGDDSVLSFHLRGASDDLMAHARTTLEQVRRGTYRYTPPGPFGEAVEQARDLARWADTDTAWRTLLDALPVWQPLGPDHLAPLGWLADPLLGPLLTPERGRELLSTPRGGHPAAPPPATPALNPPGLTWLAEPDPFSDRTSYRFVLLEGVEPHDVPARLADAPDTPLNAPMTLWEAQSSLRHNRTESSSYDDKALMAVGRAGPHWSFAFDDDPAPFDAQRFVSPAAPASTGTRAVVLWSGLRSWHGDPFFHLSVAENGTEQYAFTHLNGRTHRTGDIPDSLNPTRFFPHPNPEPLLLEAVTQQFNVTLPHHALTHGRLHTFTTRSWTRPPRDGETYAVIRLEFGGPQGD